MSQINILLRATDEASAIIGDAGNKITKSMNNMDKAGKQVTASQKEFTRSNKDLVVGLSSVATAGFSLYNAFDRIQSSQVALDRANLAVKTSLASVEDAEKRFTDAVAKYGETSPQAAEAARDLALAQERAAVAADRADLAQGNVNQSMANAALQIIPTAITAFSGLSNVWKNLPDIKDMLSNVATKIGSVGSAAGTAAISVAALAGGFLIADNLLHGLPENLRGVAGALTAGIAAVVAATIAWMAFEGTISVGVAVPIILAAVGVGIAGIKAAVGMAEGGIVKKPTFALIGEAGPEAVIPLKDLASSGNTTVIVQIENAYGFDDFEDKVQRAAERGSAEAFRRRK